ncbi:DNA repair protein RecO [Luteibacter sp. SG786]|uniref:DNA repair protein RecO n=1 Tax=Luteibacter sp. SG786 TaxID=2587130 RepID=UPI001423258F|nr:DNA repair protein RecO [Luteibacter sp. SG786]NII54787.1 DNA repair protein RecO (recombination protein O) [Luteibacter sp. SG786]
MRVEQQPAFVLHARPYRETSLLIECLTRDHGRIGVVARGVRKERARLQRAQLEPFQRVELDLLMRGELATLRAAEPSGAVLRLVGDAGLAGLYLNELVVRLTGRQDPNPELFALYELALQRMAAREPLAWTLRRFERDMLDALGYALQLDADALDGEPLDPAATYFYDPESGPMPGRAGDPRAIRGADLLALAQDMAPDTAGLASLRRMMRQVIAFHLGGGELRAWRVLR